MEPVERIILKRATGLTLYQGEGGNLAPTGLRMKAREGNLASLGLDA